MIKKAFAWLCDVLSGTMQARDLRPQKHVRAWIAAAVLADLMLLIIQIYLCLSFTGEQLSDARSYLDLALYCAENNTGYPGTRDMFALYIFGNGYVNLLSWLMRITPSMLWVYLTNIVSTQIIVFSTADIAYRITGRQQSACLSAIFVCMMGGIWGDVVAARTELCFMAFAMLSLCLMYRGSMRTMFFAGVAIGLANWIRPLLIIYLPAAVIFFLIRRVQLRKVAAYLIAIVLVVSAAGADAYSRTGEFVFQAQTMGVNMLMGANDDADGSYVSEVYDEGKAGYVPEGSGMTFMQRDAHYKRIAIDWIKTHPIRFLSLIPAKLFYFLATDTYGGSAFFSNEILTDNLAYILSLKDILLGHGTRAFAAGDAVAIFSQITYMLVFVLYVLSIIDGIRRRYIADLLPLHIIFALACGVTILTVGGARYHLPYLPFFCLCAAIVLGCRAAASGRPHFRNTLQK